MSGYLFSYQVIFWGYEQSWNQREFYKDSHYTFSQLTSYWKYKKEDDWIEVLDNVIRWP